MKPSPEQFDQDSEGWRDSGQRVFHPSLQSIPKDVVYSGNSVVHCFKLLGKYNMFKVSQKFDSIFVCVGGQSSEPVSHTLQARTWHGREQ